MMLRGIKTHILKLTKNDVSQSLEGKIFHAFCLIGIIAALLSFVVNLYIGLYTSIWISLAVFFFQSVVFYLSKVKGKLDIAILISSIEVNLLLCANYFFNAGIKGPSLLLIAVTLLFIITVGKRNTAFFWFCCNLVMVAGLLGLEYFDSDIIQRHYDSRRDYFLDIYFSYSITVAIIFTGIIYLRNSYLNQKKSVLQKAQALEKLNSEKDKLFSIISHDLRTPLANVQQYLEMMEVVDLTKDEKQVIEKDLLHITRNAQDLLTNLLQWSRNQMEGVTVNKASFNLLSGMEKTLTNMHLLAAKKDLKLVENIQADCVVFADADMLNLIIRNLLHNAIKFTPFGGVVEIGAINKNNECVIHVKDSGNGISLQQQRELFTLKTKTTFGTNKEKGTGIGLMLCKEYTEMQNGKIWFDTRENFGTIFYLSFPNE